MAKSGPNTSISLATLASVQAAAQPAADVPPVQSLLAAVNDARESTLDLLDTLKVLMRGPREPGDTFEDYVGQAVDAQQRIRLAEHRVAELVANGVAKHVISPGGLQEGQWLADLLAGLGMATRCNVSEIVLGYGTREALGERATTAGMVRFLEGLAADLGERLTRLGNIVTMPAGSAEQEAPTPRRKNRVKPATERPLSALQSETVQVVGECKGNYAEAAKRMGKDRKTVEECYKTAMKKLGRAIVKHKTKAMGTDRRGQADIGTDDDRRLN